MIKVRLFNDRPLCPWCGANLEAHIDVKVNYTNFKYDAESGQWSAKAYIPQGAKTKVSVIYCPMCDFIRNARDVQPIVEQEEDDA